MPLAVAFAGKSRERRKVERAKFHFGAAAASVEAGGLALEPRA
jgi:hypothetical protein